MQTLVKIGLWISAFCLALSAQANIITISDVWGPGNATAPSRPLLFGAPIATCASPQPFPGANTGGPFNYDVFNFFNYGPATCVTVSWIADNPNPLLAVVAYGGGFDPLNPSTDFLADSSNAGAFSPFSFTVAADSAFQLVAYAFAANTGGTYSFSVEGETIGQIPEPATLALVGMSLVSLIGLSRRRG